jgi:hypothetical protein
MLIHSSAYDTHRQPQGCEHRPPYQAWWNASSCRFPAPAEASKAGTRGGLGHIPREDAATSGDGATPRCKMLYKL